jgi:hypothetical protein
MDIKSSVYLKVTGSNQGANSSLASAFRSAAGLSGGGQPWTSIPSRAGGSGADALQKASETLQQARSRYIR